MAGRPHASSRTPARWVERGVAPPPLTPSLVPGNQRELEVAPVDAAGTADRARIAGRDADLVRRQVDRRCASKRRPRTAGPRRCPNLPAGEYEYALASDGAGSLTGKLAVPYPAEFRLGRIDTTPLGPLAAAGGGTTLARRRSGRDRRLLAPPLVAVRGARRSPASWSAPCLRLLARGWGGEDDEPPNRQDSTERDADPADLQPEPV